MKKLSKIYGIYLPVFLLVMPAAVILRTVACIKVMQPNGRFASNLMINISNGLIVGAILFFLTYLFFARKRANLLFSFSSPLNYIPAALVGTALLFLSVSLFTNSDENSYKKFGIIVGISAIIAISYFVSSVLMVQRRSTIRADLGLTVLVFLCLYTSHIYFSNELPLNSHTKVIDIVTYLSCALFFLYETRVSLGREKWRCYITFGMICATMCAYDSIPALITYFAKQASGEIIPVTFSVYGTVLAFAFFIFSSLKLALVGVSTEENSSKIINQLKETLACYEDETEVQEDNSESTAEENEMDENQLSILPSPESENQTYAAEDVGTDEERSDTDTVTETAATYNEDGYFEEDLSPVRVVDVGTQIEEKDDDTK